MVVMLLLLVFWVNLERLVVVLAHDWGQCDCLEEYIEEVEHHVIDRGK